MGLSYTAAADRDRSAPRVRRLDALDLLLLATTCIAAMAIALAYFGRLGAIEFSARGSETVPVVDLNTVVEVGPIDAALMPVFHNDGDRRLAADHLFRFLTDERSAGRTLPNVGALARIRVRAADIDRARHLETFATRLQQARETAAHDGLHLPEDLPLLTSGDLSTLKPSLVVRTNDEFHRQVVLFSAVYLLGFLAVAVVGRVRRTEGDRLLFAVVHLLTAIGFAVLLSRPDPLRDIAIAA